MTPEPDHALRESLHEEVHSRPPIALWPEEKIVLQALLLTSPRQREAQIAWIASLTHALKAVVHPVHGGSVRVLELAPEPQRLILKWELHGEYVSLIVFEQQLQTCGSFRSHRDQTLARVQARFRDLGVLPLPLDAGERIAALDVCLRTSSPIFDAAQVAPLFNDNTLIGATILSSQKAQVWTDMQLDEDGFIRILVNHQGLSSRQAGRTVQRLIDIDTYRMMSMLGMPRAKALSEPLRTAELELARLAAQMAKSGEGQQPEPDDIATDHQLLQGLSSLASNVEQWISEHGLRFTASEAYTELVRRALGELQEKSIPGVQTISEFMDRRFEPAMRTCRWTQRRLSELSDRVSKTTQILRTRIDFTNERQTQALLASMDRRAKLQLRLQQTVEGLSLVVLTYYAVGLLAYGLKGVKALGLDVPADALVGISVPAIAVTLAWGIRRARRRFLADSEDLAH